MRIYQQLWKDNQDIIDKIISMDFIQEMLSGQLSEERFYYYIEQDIYYLYDYIRAASFLAARSEDTAQLIFFHNLADSGFVELNKIHYQYIDSYQAKNTYTPAYLNYRSFILSHTASESLAVAYTAILVCPWLYIFIGDTFASYNFANPKYQYWFEANAGSELQKFLVEAQELFEFLAQKQKNDLEEIKQVFRQALLFEYTFWQDAYELKTALQL
ncbi:MAG: TenA family protein [Brevinema sp.]